ncbi:MAG: adenosylmethionine--8-amino-7-oxononanoate transaminase [Gammaproteobacteria bacterium]|nr:adenosylmethionine--8-amino-7-oxononanoate transaminase [Gammaproteobacteria bacterium]MBU1415306.1 adenosylmethionine--8-amino-7-oxononanoate transaminase [Gammaproteobacteria bacterium]
MQDPLLQRSLKSVWHPCTQMQQHDTGALPLLPVARGEGPWLIGTDGQRWLDGISSWWVNLFGHCNPRINAALRDQLETLEHVLLAGCTHAPVVELAERLSVLTNGELGHCFFGSDGASATEIALKMSAHYWRNVGRPEKNRFLCLAGGYHGETMGALGVTDIAIFRDAYAPLIRAATVLPSPDSRNGPDAARAAADALAAHLEAHHSETAALIVEPLVQCAAGMAMHEPEYLRLARALCDRYEVHLICDEIAVGCGRTGTFFAHEQANIRPDFLCLSKGITGGYLPLSVVMTREAIYAAFLDDATARGFLHSHSYTGNPLACRAALATLDIFAQDNVLAANVALGDRIDARLRPLAGHPRVSHYRRRGMIFAFDVETDPGFGRRYYHTALQHGVLVRPIANTVYLMPPYTLDEASMDHLCNGVAKALEVALTP